MKSNDQHRFEAAAEAVARAYMAGGEKWLAGYCGENHAMAETIRQVARQLQEREPLSGIAIRMRRFFSHPLFAVAERVASVFLVVAICQAMFLAGALAGYFLGHERTNPRSSEELKSELAQKCKGVESKACAEFRDLTKEEK